MTQDCVSIAWTIFRRCRPLAEGHLDTIYYEMTDIDSYLRQNLSNTLFKVSLHGRTGRDRHPNIFSKPYPKRQPISFNRLGTAKLKLQPIQSVYYSTWAVGGTSLAKPLSVSVCAIQPFPPKRNILSSLSVPILPEESIAL